MSKTLKISDDLSLPIDTVTQSIGMLAKRRAGKSYTMRRLVEQFLTAGQQVVIVDPKGDQWGLRFAADGKGPGFPIIILGGERGDAPLESTAGEVVAKLVVEERVSVLLDLSLFRKHELATFMAGFLETLYRLKAIEKYRTPMMLAIDEADAIAPQDKKSYGATGGNVERMLGAAEDIVRRGGQRGIGCTLVTQRSAVLNKNVLTQVQIMVAMRTIAPQDLAAMNAWIDVHGTPEQKKTLMESLPSLPTGDAWFWSPGWPTDEGIFKRVRVLPIETFDSGATPKPGEKRFEPRQAADVDLEALKRQMAATIEKAKENDPKLLKQELAKLRAELAKAQKPAPTPAAKTQTKTVEKAVLKDGQLKRAEALVEKLTGVFMKAGELQQTAKMMTDEIAAAIRKVNQPAPAQAVARVAPVAAAPVRRIVPPARSSSETNGDAASVGKGGLRRILIALAQRPGLTNRQIGVRAGLSSSSGSFSTYLSIARKNGWISDDNERRFITDEGLAALGDYEPLPSGPALLNHWLSDLGNSGAARILRTLADAYPNALTNEEIGQAAEISHSSGSFSTYMSRLRTLELVESAGRGLSKASDELFEEAVV